MRWLYIPEIEVANVAFSHIVSSFPDEAISNKILSPHRSTLGISPTGSTTKENIKNNP